MTKFDGIKKPWGLVDQNVSLRDGAEIFFVRQDGLATKANAKDPSSASTSMSVASLNSSLFLGEFNPNDIIIVSGRGGTITDEILVTVSQGAKGAPLRIFSEQAVPSKHEVTGNDACIQLLNASYVDVGFFTDLNNLNPVSDQSLLQFNGVSQNVNVEGCIGRRNRNGGGTVGGDFISLFDDAEVFCHNVAATDYAVAAAMHQAFTAHNRAKLYVDGYSVTNGAELVNSIDDSETYLKNGYADNFVRRIIDAGGRAKIHVYNSHLIVNGSTALPGCSTTGSEVVLGNCHLVADSTLSIDIKGMLHFDRCYVHFKDRCRWQMNEPEAVWKATNSIFRIENSNWGIARTVGSGGGGGSIQVDNCLFDAEGIAGSNRVFYITGHAADAPSHIRKSVFTKFSTITDCITSDNTGGASNPLILEDITCHHGSKFIDYNDGNVTANNILFVDVITPFDGNPTSVTNCGFDNSGSPVGTNAKVDKAALTDPANYDFTDDISALSGIGANRSYSY